MLVTLGHALLWDFVVGRSTTVVFKKLTIQTRASSTVFCSKRRQKSLLWNRLLNCPSVWGSVRREGAQGYQNAGEVARGRQCNLEKYPCRSTRVKYMHFLTSYSCIKSKIWILCTLHYSIDTYVLETTSRGIYSILTPILKSDYSKLWKKPYYNNLFRG